MLLQPRNFVSKKKQKSRKLRQFKTNWTLKYGSSGLLILRPIQLTGQQIFRLKLFLKKSVKKGDKTRRLVWFYAFPHLPLTKKPVGLRMGKGKGKLHCWFSNIRGGVVLFEFKNLRFGRAHFFLQQMTFKLGIPTKHLTVNSSFLPLPFKISKTTRAKAFWC
jgi:large subunit ribosomal protein L16